MSEENNSSNDDLDREKINEELNKIKQNGKTLESETDSDDDIVTCYMVVPVNSHPNKDDSDDKKQRLILP